MFPVSTAYKEAIQLHRKQGFRNTFKARIYLGAFDPTAMGDVVLSDNGHTAQSTLANINAEAVYTSYATWENNSFSLDGLQRFMPRKNMIRKGNVVSLNGNKNVQGGKKKKEEGARGLTVSSFGYRTTSGK